MDGNIYINGELVNPDDHINLKDYDVITFGGKNYLFKDFREAIKKLMSLWDAIKDYVPNYKTPCKHSQHDNQIRPERKEAE